MDYVSDEACGTADCMAISLNNTELISTKESSPLGGGPKSKEADNENQKRRTKKHERET